MKHTLVTIGYLGSRRAYLDLSKEEAFNRYLKAEGEVPPHSVRSFEFDDEFEVYDAWATTEL